MELTPQVINEVEFSMARRGYDPDQVDEFLEKVATLVEEANKREAAMRDRLTAAEKRAAEAEQRAAQQPERVVHAGPTPEQLASEQRATEQRANEMSAAAEAELETLKRTLLLAQRTADAAVKEAQAEAARIRAEAEAQARGAHESTRRTVLEEIAALESTRDAMHDDVDALEAHISAQRERLEATIGDLRRIIDGANRLAPASAPIDTAVAPAPLPQPTPAPEPQPAPAPAPQAAPPAAAPAPAASGPVELVTAEDVDDTDDDEAWARFGTEEDEGPRTQPVPPVVRPEGGADDAYLSELRKAMIDDTGAPEGARVARFGRRR
jgi:DivIVA domain-containing protein